MHAYGHIAVVVIECIECLVHLEHGHNLCHTDGKTYCIVLCRCYKILIFEPHHKNSPDVRLFCESKHSIKFPRTVTNYWLCKCLLYSPLASYFELSKSAAMTTLKILHTENSTTKCQSPYIKQQLLHMGLVTKTNFVEGSRDRCLSCILMLNELNVSQAEAAEGEKGKQRLRRGRNHLLQGTSALQSIPITNQHTHAYTCAHTLDLTFTLS